MNFLDKLISGGIGDIVEKAGDVASKFIHTKDDQDAFNLKMAEIIKEKEVALSQAAQAELDTYMRDTQSARDANVKIQESDKASWMSKNISYCIDIILTLVWSSLTLYLAARALKLVDTGADLTAVLSLYSTVTAVFMIVVNFHRGTSKGSADKDKTISRMASA
jgi:hypothetical protein